MKDTNIVTKLTKLDISRIALCKSPADQDGNFVIVKSEESNDGDDAAADDPVVDEIEKTDDATAGAASVKIEMTDEVFAMIQKAIDDGIKAAIEKSPVLADTQSVLGAISADPAADDDGGKEAIQNCIKELVKDCNKTKIVPKNMKKQVANIAKYHGVEGPVEDDGIEAAAFAEVTTELKTVVEILKAFAVSMAKMPSQQAAPAPAAPTKKSTAEDDERIARLEKGFEKARFALLQAMGKDPTPPGQ